MKSILPIDLIERGIYWTDTWNPIKRVGGGYGCTKISPACDHCWAEGINNRFHGSDFNRPHHEFFEIDERILTKPLAKNPKRHKKPQIYATQWMGDMFHEDVPFECIARMMEVMACDQCRNHVFLPLTKRPERIGEFLDWYLTHWGTGWFGDSLKYERAGKPPDNIIMGTTVESADYLWRIDELCKNWHGRKFVSLEPLLGDVGKLGDRFGYWTCPECGDVRDWDNHAPYTDRERNGPEDEALCLHCEFAGKMPFTRHIDWAIVGGESGPGARPVHPDWIRSIRDQCKEAKVPFFLKQMKIDGKIVKLPELDGRVWHEIPSVSNNLLSSATQGA